jgi:hypothetical protein
LLTAFGFALLAAGENLLTAGRQLALGPHRQGEQSERLRLRQNRLLTLSTLISTSSLISGTHPLDQDRHRQVTGLQGVKGWCGMGVGGWHQKASLPTAAGQGLRRWWFSSGVGGQPGRKVVRAREVEQGHSCGEGFAYGEGFQLTQGQGLDLGGGGVCEGGAAAVELAERHLGFTEGFLFLAALSQPVLLRPSELQVRLSP